METETSLECFENFENFENLDNVDWHPLPEQVEGWNLSLAVRELGEGLALAIAQHVVVCDDCARMAKRDTSSSSSQLTPLETDQFWPDYIDERTLVG
ncbi:MAG: hypothetical protein QXK26_02805 [Candidatus Bathyarchaeia archaeon]